MRQFFLRRPVECLFLATVSVGAAGTACDPALLAPPASSPIPIALADPAVADLLRPAPRLPVGFYDFFGELETPAGARQRVMDAGLDPNLPDSYLRLGLIHITEDLIDRGSELFHGPPLGDFFTLGNILSLGSAFGKDNIQIALDSFDPALDPDGSLSFLRDLLLTAALRPKVATTNLQITLSRPLMLGSNVFRAGSVIDTGVDVAAGELLPVGFGEGGLSCALCHSAVDPASGRELTGAPNTDLNVALFIALSPNTAAVFFQLNRADFDPMSPRFPKTGRRIIDSSGNTVQLPDPVILETAIDDFILTVPRGSFDSGPDYTSALTKIPDSWVFGEGGMGFDGGFNVGPFGGVTAFSNAVHAFEINLLSPANFSEAFAGLDPEVYLGVVLQNAPDPALRIPDDVQPTRWLAERFPRAERDVLIELPTYPGNSLLSLNGLAFSPRGERFWESMIALGAFQAALNVPPNRTEANRAALESGAVARGGRVFLDAGCAECHPPPFFTNRRIVSNEILGANTGRGASRQSLVGLLVESVVPAFDQPVPLPPDPPLITIPPNEFTTDNLTLPPGLDNPVGGYKVAGLRGIYLRAPYLHDAGVAVGRDALTVHDDGSYEIIDAASLGVPGTSRAGAPIAAAHSLRALLDRDLRQGVVGINLADPDLVRAHIDGTGHEFFVDPGAGFSFRQQSDLIDFLLALDDDPGRF